PDPSRRRGHQGPRRPREAVRHAGGGRAPRAAPRPAHGGDPHRTGLLGGRAAGARPERRRMKIAKVEALHCDGGWRPWTFVRIETDDGLVGWGECSDNRSPYGIAGCVRDLEDLLIGQDPRPVERLYWDMIRRTRQNLGGVTHKAIAGIELALWDIKAKA